jgi:hypothetical protein
MLTSLIIVVILLLVWAQVWRSDPKLAFGIFLGLPIAWVCFKLIEHHVRGVYLTGMDNVPLWLPMLPFATVAVTLLIFGALVWFKGDKFTLKPRERDPHHQSHPDSHPGNPH